MPEDQVGAPNKLPKLPVVVHINSEESPQIVIEAYEENPQLVGVTFEADFYEQARTHGVLGWDDRPQDEGAEVSESDDLEYTELGIEDPDAGVELVLSPWCHKTRVLYQGVDITPAVATLRTGVAVDDLEMEVVLVCRVSKVSGQFVAFVADEKVSEE